MTRRPAAEWRWVRSDRRAIEVLLGADDVPGDLAELYGYVKRSLPDTELDGFVDALAMRIALLDKQAIEETRQFVIVSSLPPDSEIAPNGTRPLLRRGGLLRGSESES